jgi:succinate dehydrogenase / fumarate reductase membrane anchor subunit
MVARAGSLSPERGVSPSPTAIRRAGGPANLEFYSWYFLRLSGLLLVVLALGHFAIMHVLHSILEVDYDFAVRRWAIPAWRIYDWLLLALTLLHGFDGLRVVVNEYVHVPTLRRAAQAAVALLTVAFLLLGTYTVVTFR